MSKLTVLIVEDSPAECAILRSCLTQNTHAAYRVLEAPTGKAALELLRHESPDCILLDLHLSDMDEQAFLTALLYGEDSLRFPVIVLTCAGSTTHAARAMKLGAQDYLIKDDVTQEALARTIRNAIEKHILQRQVEAQGEELSRKNAELETANVALRESKAALEFTLEAAEVGDWDLDLLNDTSRRWRLETNLLYLD